MHPLVVWYILGLTLQEVIKMDVDHIENLEKNLVVLYFYLCSEYVHLLYLLIVQYNRGLKQDDWTLAEHAIVELTPTKGTSVRLEVQNEPKILNLIR